jgi:Serine/Threonine/Tyrosine Kinase found in polyvalent proteins
MKNELRNIFSGKSQVRYGAIIYSISNYLRESQGAGAAAEREKYFKKQEAQDLEQFIFQNNLWIDNVDFSQYVSEGAEQKVYLKDTVDVIKLNDAIYYNSWLDYFHNLLLHNYFFPDTAYELQGFVKQDEVLYAVVRQAFVEATDATDLSVVRQFLKQNGLSIIGMMITSIPN